MPADARLIGTPVWRSLVYQNGAFWPGLLHGWRPNYDLQPWTMFVSYAFLHGGFGHLAGNMLTLVALGRIVAERAGTSGFAIVYAISAFGGALAFARASTSPQPMVGASGALFGLAGAWQYWEYADAGRDPWRVARSVAGLVLLNVILWVLLEGLLAWEAHLGGFLAGWAVAAGLAWWDRRRSRSER